jgi:hypothetical protein
MQNSRPFLIVFLLRYSVSVLLIARALVYELVIIRTQIINCRNAWDALPLRNSNSNTWSCNITKVCSNTWNINSIKIHTQNLRNL